MYILFLIHEYIYIPFIGEFGPFYFIFRDGPKKVPKKKHPTTNSNRFQSQDESPIAVTSFAVVDVFDLHVTSPVDHLAAVGFGVSFGIMNGARFGSSFRLDHGFFFSGDFWVETSQVMDLQLHKSIRTSGGNDT